MTSIARSAALFTNRLLPWLLPALALVAVPACGGNPSGTGGSSTGGAGGGGTGGSGGTGATTGAGAGGTGTGGTGGSSACNPGNCPGVCEDDVCTRYVSCEPAPLGAPGEVGTLQDPAFLKSLVDLEFDSACNAWGVTIISGQDYLRSIDPAGVVSSYAGVTNLNMGEVSILQNFLVPKSNRGAWPTPPPPADLEVALTYVCCAGCGCQLDSTPQGVSRFDPATGQLPLVIPSMSFTTGQGPFGSVYLDTGPAGLTYGTDLVLYVGNVDVNGDYYRLDLTSSEKTLFTTFESRVYASAPFDDDHMLVALESGEVRLLSLAGATSALFTTSDQPVTGMIRDFFDGTVYIARQDGQIWKYTEDGAGELAWTAKNRPRLSIAPDGYLYAIEIALPVADVQPPIERWQLPLTK